MLNHPNLKEK